MRVLGIILLFVCSLSYGQLYHKGQKSRFGIKTALNFSMYHGNEFENPRLRFGYTAGIYFRTAIGKSNHIHAEFLGNFKGSRFKNSGPSTYVEISAFHLDLPIYYVIGFKDNAHNIMIGPQLSHHLLSSLFIKNKGQAHETGLSFAPLALDACLAYQYNGANIGIQVGAKLGITNLNDGINFEDVDPATGKGGFIRMLSFETALIF